MAQVVPINQKLSSDDIREAQDVILREWVLTPAQFQVLMFIADRTIRWGKRAESISIRQITHGVFNKDGHLVRHGIGQSRSTVLRALSSLEQSGHISVRRTHRSDGNKNKNIYTINWENNMLKTPKTGARSKVKSGLKQSKKLTLGSENGGEKEGDTLVSNLHHPSIKMTPYNIPLSNIPLNEESASHAPASEELPEGTKASLEETLKKVKKRTEEKRQKKLQKGTSLQKIFQAWELEIKNLFPDYPVMQWTGKQFGQVKSIKAKIGEVPLWDFLYHCIVNWRLIHASKLSWMSTHPAAPDIGHICVRVNDFLEVMGKEAQLRRLAKLDGRERRIERMVESGIDQQEAERQVQEHYDPMAKERQQLTKERETLARRARELELASMYANRGLPESSKKAITRKDDSRQAKKPKITVDCFAEDYTPDIEAVDFGDWED